jgi:hypothetical protein
MFTKQVLLKKLKYLKNIGIRDYYMVIYIYMFDLRLLIYQNKIAGKID